MATVLLSGATWTNGFGATDLNSLANGSQKTSTLTAPQIDNSTAGQLYVQFEVVLAALSPTAGASVIVVLIPETRTSGAYVAGTDGATVETQVRWQNYPYAIVALTQGASAAQTQRSVRVEVLNERYKVALINRAGTALAASGNQVAWRLVTENVA